MRKGRVGLAAHGTLVLALVATVLVVAYGVSAPQLGVAEFAPSAQQSLDQTPPTNDNDRSGPGRSGRGRSTTTRPGSGSSTATSGPDGGDPASPTSLVGRSRRCYGDPPRQIEDPMSPPCVATIFEGDNGGATSTGVTATDIRVGVPITGSATDEWHTGPITAIFDYINQNFEFYGRRLVPVFSEGSSSRADAARARAEGMVAQSIFAALTAAGEIGSAQAALPTALARAKVVTVTRSSSTWWSDRTMFDLYHPYIWSAFPSSEDLEANIGDFACRSLAGGRATHTIDADLDGKERRFGIISASSVTPPPANALAKKLESCTGVPTAHMTVSGSSADSYRVAMQKLEAQGVTTMICACEGNAGSRALDAARGFDYFPEWIYQPTANWTHFDEGWLSSYGEYGWMSPPMRLDAGPRMVPFQARPYFPALLPLFATTPPNDGNWNIFAIAEFVWAPMLVLASGIQGAGPNLTADGFAAALMSMQFPNPGVGQAPYWQGSAGFGPGDHSFYDDYNVAWWDQGAEQGEVDSRGNKGSWCYLDRAKRFTPGSYPTDAESRMFTDAVPCR